MKKPPEREVFYVLKRRGERFSELVLDKPLWGLKVLKFDGAIAPRVLKFDSGFAAEGCGGRHMDKPCGLEG